MSNSSASRQEAKNFHVLPKDGTKKDAGKQPSSTPTPAQQADVSLSSGPARDPEAGSRVEDPTRSGQANTPLDAPRRGEDDRSNVS